MTKKPTQLPSLRDELLKRVSPECIRSMLAALVESTRVASKLTADLGPFRYGCVGDVRREQFNNRLEASLRPYCRVCRVPNGNGTFRLLLDFGGGLTMAHAVVDSYGAMPTASEYRNDDARDSQASLFAKAPDAVGRMHVVLTYSRTSRLETFVPWFAAFGFPSSQNDRWLEQVSLSEYLAELMPVSDDSSSSGNGDAPSKSATYGEENTDVDDLPLKYIGPRRAKREDKGES